MFHTIRVKRSFLLAFLLACAVLAALPAFLPQAAATKTTAGAEKRDFIKWVDFGISRAALQEAMELDIKTREDPEAVHVDWVEALAFLGAKYGGDFSRYRSEDLEGLAQRAEQGETIASQGADMPYYSYYSEAYQAVLRGFLGEYEMETGSGWETCYGLKAYSPIAKTFPYSDYDDFGTGRSYGYRRKHLGHDMMAAVGTPVIAVESGVVEALGWNQYGGWRIGIRSFDGKRYHYYAHLRQNRPYAQGLEVGQTVMAGDVIGYVGRTGYSAKENTNNIDVSHLHYGLQLIFDESQKEGAGEIWIDVYSLCCFLKSHQSEVQREDATKEWSRVRGLRETVPEDCFRISEKEESGM